MMRALLSLCLLLVFSPGQAAPPRTDADVADAVDFAPPLDTVVPDLIFSGSGTAGESPVALQQLLARRPTLLTFAWFECANLCGLTLNALADSSARLPADALQDFQIVVVSLDGAAGPDQARQQQRELARRYPDAGIARRWHFLTGDTEVIKELANAVGYRFLYDQRKEQFAHPAGIVALSRDGRIVDYQAGVNYRARNIENLLQVARGGTPSAPDPNPILLLCYDYDPNSGRYSLAIMKVLRLTAVISLLVIAGAMLYWQRKGRRGAK